MGPELDLTAVARLLLAALLGGMIGLEREIHGRPAGFRTHLLVSLGSCLFCVTSVEFYRHFGDFSGVKPVGVDPGRIAAQVVTGIGFLGAGAIIRDKATVRGLTTAACLWVAAALGLACGIGLFYLAIGVTAVALLSLLLLKEFEKKLTKDSYLSVGVWGNDSDEFLARACAVFVSLGMNPEDGKYEKNIKEQTMHLQFQVKRSRRATPADILTSLSMLPGVMKVRVD